MDRKIANLTYTNSIRNTNLCGGSAPDSLDQVHSLISHTASSIAINITIPANVSLVIHSVKLDVGTCPRNCLQCSSPSACITCKPYYDNINGVCQCN